MKKTTTNNLFFSFFIHSSYTVPDYKKNLEAAIDYTTKFPSWERFAIEMVLTFLVVLAYFMATDSHKTYFGVSALSIGCAYSAGSFVSVSINHNSIITINFRMEIRSCDENPNHQRFNEMKTEEKKCITRQSNYFKTERQKEGEREREKKIRCTTRITRTQ